MRFAIALLSLICIASVIGTVVKQHEPANNYINQFGPFWAEVFGRVGLFTVYSAWWFLLILAFLVASVSLCIARNAPKILIDLRSYKEGVREQALASFHHKAQGQLAMPAEAALQRISEVLASFGWQARAQVREHGTMVAARKGVANKIGYLSAHSAIVLICLGGLLDGDLIVRTQMALLGKSAYAGGGLVKDVPAQHRLSPRNPTFRGNLLVPEAGRSGTAILNMADGVVLQDLPFDVELKKFIVEYYDTGMPKLFASEIVIHDRDSGQAIPATVKVNEPAYHRGIAIFQSSFDDGGSKVKLRGWPLQGGTKPFEVEGVIGESTQLSRADSNEKLSLEFSGLRVINVENFGATPAAQGATDVRKVDLVSTLDKHLGSGAKAAGDKALRNVGPSVSYKLRDASGQAREYQNYMLPVQMDGQRVFLAGLRDTPSEPYRYLRIPVDDQGGIEGWQRLNAALHSPAARAQAAKSYAAAATPPDKPQMAEQLQLTALRALSLFAGAGGPVAATAATPSGAATAATPSGAATAATPSGAATAATPSGAAAAATPSPAASAPSQGGLAALAQFIETTVPEPERARISDVLLRILNASLFELTNQSREQVGLKPLQPSEETQAFMQQAVLSLSDAAFYPAPMLFQLADFTHVQASVFQLARAPGHYLVYFGAALLIIGVFTMLYVRERRMWIWLSADGQGGTKLSVALSTTRRTLDADAEFDAIRTALLKDAT